MKIFNNLSRRWLLEEGASWVLIAGISCPYWVGLS